MTKQFSAQLLDAVQELTVEFIAGVQRLTAPLTRTGRGYASVPLETGTRIGDHGWTISLQDKLMAVFPELETPAHVKLALELVSMLPGARIGVALSRVWETDDQGRRVPTDRLRVGRDGQPRHDVFLRRMRTGGLDPTDPTIEPAKPIDPTETENAAPNVVASNGESLDL